MSNIIKIENRIFTFRDLKVMLDSDLAEIYNVETKVLNQAVKRNSDRFPESFMFRLTEEEYLILRSQNVTSKEGEGLKSQNVTSKRGGRRYAPNVFTEHGAVMLASVLKSEEAINASVKVVSAFVEMRRFIESNEGLFKRLDIVEKRMMLNEEKVDKVYRALDFGDVTVKQGIFYDGQVFDAYKFINDIIRSAKTDIVLIDNYIDDTILLMFDKRKTNVKATIFTKTINKKLALDLKKHNEQYQRIEIKTYNKSHDRFLIIDRKIVYHIGASLKDLGKKWFGFSRFEQDAKELLKELER